MLETMFYRPQGLFDQLNSLHQALTRSLGADGSPELVWVDGMKRGVVRRAMKIVVEQQEQLLARWREVHG